jgi:hypothetical protein
MAARLNFRGWNRQAASTRGPWPVLVRKVDTNPDRYEATIDPTALTLPRTTAPTAEEALTLLRDAWSRDMHADYGPQDFVATHIDETETNEADETTTDEDTDA